MFTWIAVAGVGAVAFLGWNLYRRFSTSRIAALNDRRRSTSRMVSPGEFVDGNRHLDVALALTKTDFYYENADMEASLELQLVREIEYDSRLSTGQNIEGGEVLRLRCSSQVFEFVVPDDVAERWHSMLPARGEAGAAASGTVPAPPAN